MIMELVKHVKMDKLVARCSVHLEFRAVSSVCGAC
jgi:hypothetical protein